MIYSRRVTGNPAQDRELDKIEATLRQPSVLFLMLEQLNAAPARPSDGMVVYADGTNWDPGSGEGIYAYYGAAWNLLG